MQFVVHGRNQGKFVFKITARTVLELGAELISSDIIAFYELIKNAYDARSRTGADVHFNIVLRRNTYLRIRKNAELAKQQPGRAEALANLHQDLKRSLETSAGPERIARFMEAMDPATTLENFIKHLDDAYRKHNTIVVADTGTGMSVEELSANYLTIGTPSRKKAVDKAVESQDEKPPFLGEKGIGRLSAMRLGETLTVQTAREEDEWLNRLDVDWRDFNDIDAMIEDIDVEPYVSDVAKPAPDWAGTTLRIGDISEDWTEKRVQEMAEYDFARLTDPFQDPKGRPRIALHWNGARIAIPWMSKQLLDAAHASFRGEYLITDNGPELVVHLEARNLGYPHPVEKDTSRLTLPDLQGLLGPSHSLPLSALESLGRFEFEAYWYNRRYLTGIDTIGNQKVVRDLQRKWSGIMLFRDGFRVFPYGDDEDDWLGLDRRALGRSGYVLNKAQFVGRVGISRAVNPGLLDQTNREGLRASPEQGVFIAVLQHVVRDMLWDFFREIDSKYKKNPVNLGDVKAEINTLEARARSALSRVKRLVPKSEAEVVDELNHAFVEFKELAARAQERAEQVENDSKQMLQMAGVGLMVEVIAHELARASEAALDALDGLRGKDLPQEVKARLETLRAEMKSVSKRLRVLDQMSVSGRQRSEVFDLVALLEDMRDGHAAQFVRHNITLELDVPNRPVRVKLVKGMVVQILENLVSNSIYWLQMRASREPSFSPTIRISLDTNPLEITYHDNGQGIAPDHQEKVFRPFWSLKEKSKRRGLGLFIARENATYLDAKLSLADTADPRTGRLSTFILELPDGSLVK
ncbi:ATP-binding protein [Lysobacter soli]|uniref:sensor histidine kinase n=1 Tax=Lysobacter soli TaxID=453783 RepID=UPI0036D0EDB8